ncbi:MAG: hypothetical protein ISR65_02525 [Bacteriovoracaceae bacterium]|nr:hypothetical protein [Bacteriovoracaceae bacterium]
MNKLILILVVTFFCIQQVFADQKFVYKARKSFVFSAKFIYTVKESQIDQTKVKTVETSGNIKAFGISVSTIQHRSINNHSDFLPVINTQCDISSDRKKCYSQKFTTLPNDPYTTVLKEDGLYLFRQHNDEPFGLKNFDETFANTQSVDIAHFYPSFDPLTDRLHDFSSIILTAKDLQLSNQWPESYAFIANQENVVKIKFTLVKQSNNLQEIKLDIVPSPNVEVRAKNLPNKILLDTKKGVVLQIHGNVPKAGAYTLKLDKSASSY